MNRTPKPDRIAHSLRQLASAYGEAMRQLQGQLDDTIAALCLELGVEPEHLQAEFNTYRTADDTAVPGHPPIADRTTLSVVYGGKSCFLGNTLMFRFFETIARRPNRYFTHSELLIEVWGGTRSESTIRNVARRLRKRLVAGGLKEVARLIDGSTAGHYVLNTAGIGSSDPTEFQQRVDAE